jgi:hypothetical protein
VRRTLIQELKQEGKALYRCVILTHDQFRKMSWNLRKITHKIIDFLKSVLKAFHAKFVAYDINSDVVFPEVSEDPDIHTISLPKSLFQKQGIFNLLGIKKT